MARFPYYLIDAFTDRPLAGNACAVVLDCEHMSDETRQAIAREMNLSETAFAWRRTGSAFAARYFTPAEEIPFAGHPTVATAAALAQAAQIDLSSGMVRFKLTLPAGTIDVRVENTADGAVRVTMDQLAPAFLAEVDPAEALAAFGLKPADGLAGALPQVVSTGTPQLMVPLESHAALRTARLDIARYEALRAKVGFFSPHLFCLEGATAKGRTFARHFGVPPDTLEDPFTGSATGGMAAYLWHHGLVQERSFIAEQGHWMKRPGAATVELMGSPEQIAGIRLSGPAVTVVRGTIDVG